MPRLARLPLLLTIAVALAALAAGGAAAQEAVAIAAGDFFFCDSSFEDGVCDTTVTAGDTVLWDTSGSLNQHTVTECGSSCDSPTTSPLFDSGTLMPGDGYEFTPTEPGTYLYYCEVHPALMRGRLIVEAAQEPPTPPPPPPPVADLEPPVTPTSGATPSGAPKVGEGPDGGPADGGVWLLVGLAGAGAVLLAAGSALYRRRAR